MTTQQIRTGLREVARRIDERVDDPHFDPLTLLSQCRQTLALLEAEAKQSQANREAGDRRLHSQAKPL